MFSLDEVLMATNGNLINKNITETFYFTGTSTDSRKIKEGMLFIPLIGENYDGHDFIPDAAKNGAKAALSERDYKSETDNFIVIKVNDTLKALQDLSEYVREKYDKVKVIAITGSAGKTTTKNFVARVLSERYKVLYNEGNYNNQIGLPLTLLNMDDSYDLAVLEMGMNSFGEIKRLSEIAKQDIAVITNIGTAHIGKLGSRENILKAKLEITEYLKENNIAYLNGDDDLLKKVKGHYQIRYFGCGDNNDIKAFNIENNKEHGMEFDIRYGENEGHFAIQLPGIHNVFNSLPAIALGYDLGINHEDIYKGLLKNENEKMRLKVFNMGSKKIIDDTYNANPDSMKAAIDFLIDISVGTRKVAILGDMLELGDYSKTFHIDLGKYCYMCGVDVLITYGVMAEYIAEGAIEAGMDENTVYSFKDKDELKSNLFIILKEGDTVLIKGSRGMEMDGIVEYLGDKRNGF